MRNAGAAGTDGGPGGGPDRLEARAAAAGYDCAEYAGHSLRAGFLTSAARAGASIFKMKKVSRHKSLDVLAGCVCNAQAFTDHAGGGLRVTRRPGTDWTMLGCRAKLEGR